MYRHVILGSLAIGIALGTLAPVAATTIKPLQQDATSDRAIDAGSNRDAELPAPGVHGVSVIAMPRAMPISTSISTAAASAPAMTTASTDSAATIKPIRIVKIVSAPVADISMPQSAATATYTDMTMDAAAAGSAAPAAVNAAQMDSANVDATAATVDPARVGGMH